jgi:hypothetical protein
MLVIIKPLNNIYPGTLASRKKKKKKENFFAKKKQNIKN